MVCNGSLFVSPIYFLAIAALPPSLCDYNLSPSLVYSILILHTAYCLLLVDINIIEMYKVLSYIARCSR